MTQSEIRRAQSQEMQRVLHDLSNTLTGLLMNAGLLSLALRSNERLRRYADDIHESATRSADLLRQVRLMLDPCVEADPALTDGCDVEHTPDTGNPRRRRAPSTPRTQ